MLTTVQIGIVSLSKGIVITINMYWATLYKIKH